MTDVKKKQEEKGHVTGTIVAGIAGAIAGGAAVAAAVIMSDKKNQKKVKDALVGAKGKIEKSAQKIGAAVNDAKDKMVNV